MSDSNLDHGLQIPIGGQAHSQRMNEEIEADKATSYFVYDQYGDNPMQPVGPIALVPMIGSNEFTKLTNDWLHDRRSEYHNDYLDLPGFLQEDYRINVETHRFSTGEGKAVIQDTVRGHDLFIISDVMNYSCSYDFFGQKKRMSPDEHYQDLKRIILACSGKARRINVIMPYLYQSRQDRRNSRESLDCAYMLEQLHQLGVANILTFDAHSPRVSNAIPVSGFENIPTTYQMIKAIVNKVPELDLNSGNLVVIAPDEGAISRSLGYATQLKAPLGTFYKRRDYTRIVDGKNPIVAHEFLGRDVEGKDVLIIDDLISSGESMLDIARDMHELNVRNVYCAASFGIFVDGLDKFNEAYEQGWIRRVLCTNAIYRSPELLAAPWYVDVDLTKFVALLIDAINHDASLSGLLDPSQKIQKLLNRDNTNGSR